MSAADVTPVMLSPGRNMRGVANLITLDPGEGEPWGTNRKGKPADKSLIQKSLRKVIDYRSKLHAHLVLYYVEDADGVFDKCPRLTKEVLGQIREAGADVKMWGIGIDWDLKDHPPFREDHTIPRGEDGKKIPWENLTPEQVDQAMGALAEGGKKVTEAGCPWNVFYTTRNGCRFIHVFPESIPAGRGFENAARKVRELYMASGLHVDNSCKDWVRFFAVPRCTHDDGMQIWTEEWFEVVEQWDDFYMPDEEDMEETPEPIIRVKEVEADRPDPEEARALVEVSVNGKWKNTEAAKAARRELKMDPPVRCFDAVFNHSPLAAQGNRHTTLLESVGEVIARIHGFPWASPELVYALLMPAADLLGVDDDGTLFADKLWEMTTSIWSKEDAKAGVRREDKEAVARGREEAPVDDRDRFAAGIKKWLAEAQEKSAPEVIELVQERQLGVVFDQKRDNFHVLLPSGYYETYPCSLASLRKVVEERGIEWLVPISYFSEDKKGELQEVPLKPETIRDRSGRTFAYSEFTLQHGGSHLRIDEDGRGVFQLVPFWLRDDLVPTKFDEVYEWLRLLVKNDSARFMRALACMLAIQHGPTAAVSLIGPSGTGKSMLGMGLGDCFNTRCVVPGDVLVAKHNDAMLWSPIVHVDEGIDKGSGGIDFSNAFRRIVTGGTFSIEPKGLPRMRMMGAHRILMTANNLDTINSLGGRRARTSEDWGAISERVAHFHADDAAAEFLARGDGKRHGLDWTKSWVGAGSQWKLARTLLWIYHNELQWIDGHPVREGRRMLFEGSTDSDVMRDLEVEAVGIPELVRVINRAMSRFKNSEAAVHNGRIYIMFEKIIERAGDQSKLKASDLRDALRSLLMADQPKKRISVDGRQQRWKGIDLERFLQLLERIGEKPAAMLSGKKSAEEMEWEEARQ